MNKQEIYAELEELNQKICEIVDHDGDVNDTRLAVFLISEANEIGKYIGVEFPVPLAYGRPEFYSSVVEAVFRFQVEYGVIQKRHHLEVKYGEKYVELSKEEIRRIQDLISEARSEISDSSILSDDHKRRLLVRLEDLQSEIHKVKSDIDVALAGFSEVGLALGEFGRNAAPFAEFWQRIVNIFNDRRKASPGLPAPPKQLPAPED